MIARFEIGEVLLATTISNVLGQFRFAIVSGDTPAPDQFSEGYAIHFGKFGSLA
jgi:hypothetical protein